MGHTTCTGRNTVHTPLYSRCNHQFYACPAGLNGSLGWAINEDVLPTTSPAAMGKVDHELSDGVGAGRRRMMG